MEDNLQETAILRIQVLGQFQVWHQRELLIWPTHKSKTLFQILLIEPGRLIPTDQLMEYLWPDLTINKAKNNLWVTISQLRHVLEPDLPARAHSAFIIKQGEGYRFNSESDYWLDCETLATDLTASQSAANLNESIEAWEAARILYQGNYMEDEPYAEWVQFPRTQWRRRYEQLLFNLAQAHGRSGEYQQAINYCHEILALNNTKESTYRLLMQYHAALGERPTALQVYNEAVQVLRDELGVEPMPETDELARQIQKLEGEWKLEIVEPPVSTPFVGRGKEVTQITQLLTQTSTNHGQVMLITGEPGIGKSRLIREMTILANRQGFQSLSAQCYQVEQTMPYQPLIDLVRQIIGCGDHWRQLAPVWLRELAVLVPEIGEVAASATGVVLPSDDLDENKQVRLFQAIFNLFANQADRYKVLLVVEDIHWADPATSQCLHYLARQFTQIPIALVLSLREENISANVDLVALLHSLRREPHATSLSLARLTLADTTAFLAQTSDTADLADRLGNWLHQETDGNPFFLISLLQSLREEGLLDNVVETDWQAQVQTDPVLVFPDAIRESVLSRLQRLTQTEREVIDWIATYGLSLDFSTLQAISHQPNMTLLNTVEQLLERQLLIETAGQYDFSHNKIREVVYYDLSAARRGLYHRQIADTLEVLPLSPDKASILARHFERGEEKEKALIYWMQAGNHALDTYAYQQAAHHYEQVLALTDHSLAQMSAYLGLSRAFMLMDDHKAATAIIQKGLHLAQHHVDNSRRIQFLYVLAQNASRQHRPDGGKPEVEAVLDAAEHIGDDYHHAQSLILLTEVHESNGDLRSALKTATRAQTICNKLNDNKLEARALVEIGFLHAQQADFDEAVNAAEQGLEVLVGADDRNAIAYIWNILGRALGGRGDYSRAIDAFQHSQEEAQIIGDRYLLAQVFNMRGWLYRELGDYENGLKFDQEGVDFAKQWGKPSPEISAQLNVCLDLLHLGDPKQALELLNKTETRINVGEFGFHNWRWRLRLLHARGLCFLDIDDPAKALDLAEEGLPLAEMNITRKYVALNYELKGMALAELGKVNEAIVAMEMAVSLADTIQYQPIRWASRYKLVELYRQKDHEQEAQRASSEAEIIIQTIAGGLEDKTLRTKFFNATLPQ
jgi:predicted ATPase/DNA-binding SARP family transcriptional activator